MLHYSFSWLTVCSEMFDRCFSETSGHVHIFMSQQGLLTSGLSDIWGVEGVRLTKTEGKHLSRAPLSSQGILSKRDSTFHSVINICFSFLAWGMYCILMVCFHSSFCVFYPSLPPCLPLSHTQIRSPPSHSIDQRLVGVLDESYQQFTQFKASFKLLPFQSGTVLITDNSFRSYKEIWRTFVRWCCRARVFMARNCVYCAEVRMRASRAP